MAIQTKNGIVGLRFIRDIRTFMSEPRSEQLYFITFFS